ncbi:hypothetical protein BH11ARM1_BH11ARM1_14750 [soil metagenome]
MLTLLTALCLAASTQQTVNNSADFPNLPKPPHQAADWLVEHPPVNPNASPEAKALLHMLYQISGKNTLTGQHNFPNEQDLNTDVAAIYSGKTPALYGTDFGFAKAGDKDSAYSRHEMMQTLIKKFHEGHVLTMCWHAVPPTMDEPVTFHGEVQSKLSKAEFDELLTPGSRLNKHWLTQVDGISEYLKELQDAHVPVLWRPFHEINGDWFWWNGHLGDANGGTKQLYRMIYDRMVNFHHLNNLLWVWNPDQPSRPDRQFVDYFPGQEYVDVLAFDCYGAFQQSAYDDLNALSGGKVMGIGETRNPPSLDVYKTQPKWAFYMVWSMEKAQQVKHLADPGPSTSPVGVVANQKDIQSMVKDSRMMSLQDASYLKAVNEVLKSAGAKPVEKAPPLPKMPSG